MTGFSIDDRELLILDQFKVVEFFRFLLWAEADHHGISMNLIDIPTCINVSDGGLDAFIENNKFIENSLIPEGLSGYQIKNHNIKPQECKNELYINREKSKLKPRIHDLLEKNGTYILVIFHRLTKTMKEKRLVAIIEEFKKYVKEPKVKIYDISFLSGFIRKYPSLITYFKPNLTKAQFYDTWALNHNITFPKSYVYDKSREEIMIRVRELLRNGNTRFICIEGLYGLGKTRLVFETLKEDDLKSVTIYYKDRNDFFLNDFFNYLQNTFELNCIIVIDNCFIEDVYNIIKYFSNVHKKVRFIIITQKSEDFNLGYKNYKISRMDSKSLTKILSLEIPDMNEENKTKIVNLSHGFPYILTQLIKQYIKDPKSVESGVKLLINEDFLIKKLVFGENNIDYKDYNNIKKILLYLSLFSKIGFAGDLTNYAMETSMEFKIPMFYTNFENRFYDLSVESRWLAEKLQINWIEFRNIINELKSDEIVWGRFFISINIFPLIEIHLKKWWIDYHDETIPFLNSIPEDLKDSLIADFFFNLNFANLSYSNVYNNIINFFYDLLENEQFLDHILDFVMHNYQYIKYIDRRDLIFELIKNGVIRDLFIYHLLTANLFNLKKYEIKNWFKRLIKNNFSKNIIFVSYNYRFFIENDVLNYLLFKMINFLDNNEIFEKVIGIMLYRYDDLCTKLKNELINLISNYNNDEIISNLLLIHFLDISSKIRIKIYNILLKKSNNGFNSLLKILLIYYYEFPEKYRENVLYHLSDYKELIPFLSLMLINYGNSFNLNIKQKMIKIISSGNSVEDLAYRDLLYKTIELPNNLKIILKVSKLNKKIRKKENKIIESNREDIYSLLKLQEFKASIYKRWREKYQPQKIKLLFLTEGITPHNEKKFIYFYNPFFNQSSELFNYVMASIFPNYSLGFSSKLKANYLDKFVKKGYFLDDVFPIYDESNNKELYLKIWIDKELEKNLKLLISNDTPIIIIKEDLFNILNPKLIKLGYSNIYQEPIPFPDKDLNSFKKKVKCAIKELGLN